MKAPTPSWALALAGGLYFSLLPQASHSQALTCTAPKNTVGSIDWPAPCPFGTRPDTGTISLDGLPPGEPIERLVVITPGGIINRGPGGSLGGEIVTWTGILQITLRNPNNGAVLVRDLPMTTEVHVGRSSSPGANTQTFDTEMVSLSAALFGDPDFQTLRVTRAGGGGGTTSLTRLPTGDFNVDSFFDITYRIEFEGAGPDWGGISGTVDSDATMRQTLRVLTGFSYEPVGDAIVTQDADGLTVDNLGSSGMDGVSFRVGGEQENGFGNDLDTMSINFNPLATGVPADGDNIAICKYPPPQREPLPGVSPALDLTNTGGLVTATCHWGEVGAATTLVSVWDGGLLLAAEVVPDGAACFTCPAFNNLARLGASVVGSGRIPGAERGGLSFIMALAAPLEITLPGAAGPVAGTTVVVSALEAEGSSGGIRGVRVTGSNHDGWNVVYADGSEDYLGLPPQQGIGEASFSIVNNNLVVDNLGSSGMDGISFDLRDSEALPIRVDLLPVNVNGGGTGGGAGGGAILIGSRASDGSELGTVEYRGNGAGGGGAGGIIWIKLDGTGARTCRVQVLQDGELRGEVDLPVADLTEVAGVASGPNGGALLTGCGKLWNGSPWQFPCFVLHFDRPAEFTPGGGAPIVGNEIRLLAPDATPGVLDDLASFEILGRGIGDLIICGGTTGPFLPSPRMSPGQFGGFEFPGQYSLRASRPAYLEPPQPVPAPGAIETRPILKTFFETGRNGNRVTYDSVLQLDLTGVGDHAGYQRTIEIPGSIELEFRDNAAVTGELEQQAVWVRNWRYELPPGDPDFDFLLVTAGTDNGLPGSGLTTLTRLPSGNFQVDSFFDITYQIEFSGPPGGIIGDGSLVERSFSDTWLLTESPATAFGLAHRAMGGAELAENPTGGLTISNIGSSGMDGVSIDLPGAQAFSMEFDPANPVALAPDGLLVFEVYGQTADTNPGASLGTTTCLNRFGALFEITYDFSGSSPTSTTLEVYNKGAFVGSYHYATPDGSVLFADNDGTGLPPIKGCGKLPGLGGETPCNFIRFCGAKTFRVIGQGDFDGDEIRLLAHGATFEELTGFDLRLAGTVFRPVLLSEDFISFGRNTNGEGDAVLSRANNHNTTRSEKTSGVALSNIGSTGLDGVVIRPPRDAASGLPTGKRQHKPINVSTPDLQLGNFGASLQIEATGTIAGNPGTSFGTLNLLSGDGEVAVTPDFGGRGGGVIRLRVYEQSGGPLYQEGAGAGENPLYEGSIAGESTSGNGTPICYLQYQLEKAVINGISSAPADGNEPCRYTLVLGQNVDVELGDRSLTFPHATRIEISILDPDAPTEDLDSFALRGANLKDFTITDISTGPVFASGLPALSVGSAQIAENPAGQLVVSNLGSSGMDGVRIDLGHGEGGAVALPAPLEIAEGYELHLGVRGHETGKFETEMVSLSLTGLAPGGGGGGRVRVEKFNVRQEFGPTQSTRDDNYRVMGFDENGALTGDVVIDTVQLGEISATGPVRVVRIANAAEEFHHEAKMMGRALVLDLDGTGTFDPNGAAVFVFHRLRVMPVCPPDRPFRCVDASCAASAADCRPHQESLLLQTNLGSLTLGEVSFEQFDHKISCGDRGVCPGGVRVWPQPGYFTVANNQTSDFPLLGVSATNPSGRLGIGPITMRPIRMDIGVQAPPDEVGSLKLAQFAINGNSCGTAEIDFVEVAGGGDGVALRADFTDLQTDQVLVQVCRDGVCVGEYRTSAGEVGRGHRASIAQTHLTSVSGSGTTGVPGGILPVRYCFTFDRSVEITPPGVAPGGGIIGREVCLIADGSPVTIPALSRLTLATNLDEYEVTGVGQKNFSQFLLEHFTGAEIDELIAANFDIDHDNDGANAIVEHATGGTPTVSDFGLSRRPGSSIGTGGDGLPHLRHSVVLAPVTDVTVRMRSAEDLQNWNEDQSQFTLVGRATMPDGNVRLTWELNEPVGGTVADPKPTVQMGPIFVLQPATR